MAGLNVSIAVGQAQAGMGLFLVFVLAVYLIFTFQEPLPPMQGFSSATLRGGSKQPTFPSPGG